jgi:hypothetical protein
MKVCSLIKIFNEIRTPVVGRREWHCEGGVGMILQKEMNHRPRRERERDYQKREFIEVNEKSVISGRQRK